MTRTILALLLVLVVAGFGCGVATRGGGATPAPRERAVTADGRVEASMGFEQAWVGPFLTRLSRHVPTGLEPEVVSRLEHAIGALPVDQTGRWEITVEFRGRTERLVIVAFQDDVESPDIRFFASPELATLIQAEMQAFAEEQGA